MRAASGPHGRTPRALACALATVLLLVPGETRAGEERPVPWQVGLTIAGNFLANQPDFVQPTATVDHGVLHLEGRYNYEARETGSLWVGWNLAWGSELRFTLTPVLGGVFGSVNGLAPGVEWDLTWGPLEIQSTDEFVFDLGNWSASDFNFWAELRVWPWDWLRAGVALQHTRAVQTGRNVQWGPLLGFKAWKIDAATYWMNPDQPAVQYWIASLGFHL